MNAIVTAGGIPEPGDPLYPFTQGRSKALLDIAGQPMIQWVLDALSQSRQVERVVVVGLGPETGLACSKSLSYLPNQGHMIANITAGSNWVLEQDPAAEYALIVSSDIPTITGEHVDWVVNTSLETRHDLYYSIIERSAMEARFPGSRRTYTKLKGLTVCGGDMNMISTHVASGRSGLWDKIIEARKSALKQAALVGFEPLWLLLTRQLTPADAERIVAKRLGVRGRVLRCPYAEVGMDVDKPHQLELVRQDLARRNGRGAHPTGGG